MSKKYLQKLILLPLIFLYQTSFAQQLNFNENTFFFPHSYQQSQIISSWFIAGKLPEDVVETDDVFRAPLFSYRLKYGLPRKFCCGRQVESILLLSIFH
jgi:hypothetical protein